MTVKTIQLKDLSSEIAKAFEKAPQIMKRVVTSSIIDTLPQLIKSCPIDTGLYAQSWDLLEDEKSVVLGNYAPHAAIIEYGARPYNAPLEPLLQWAKRVLRDPSQPPKYSNDVWALAIYTRNKIRNFGQAPKHILENHLSAIIESIKEKLI